MAEETQRRETSTIWVKAVAGEVYAGSDIVLMASVSCPSACDLRGKEIQIIAQDASVVNAIELTRFDGAVNETGEFVLQAPVEPGQYSWTAVFAEQEQEGVLHEESTAPISLLVKPHATSMTVWDVPSPVVLGARFRVKVGAQCSAQCKLTGEVVEIYDHQETKVATSTLSEAPYSSAGALYWAEVELEAPAAEGSYDWKVKFPEPQLEIAHGESASHFAFVTATPPDHVVTVEVVDRDSRVPISMAFVTLHSSGRFPYRNRTSDAGLATVSVPEGEYTLYVLKEDYKDFEAKAVVAGDVAIQAELLFAPDLGG